jgi:hypothetical protein
MPEFGKPGKAGLVQTLAVTGGLLCGSMIACGSPPEPATSFARGERIPLGILSLEVRRSQEMQRMPRPFSGQAQAGEKLVAVFVHWRGLDNYDDASRRSLIDSLLCNRLRIVDSEGYAYSCMQAMPSDLFNLRPSRSLSSQWVVVFRVWVDSEGLVLQIEHPEPVEGGFRVAAVSLD